MAMLDRRGWDTPTGRPTVRTKGTALWASYNDHRDSGVDGHHADGRRYTVDFPGDVPARVIVAACVAAAEE